LFWWLVVGGWWLVVTINPAIIHIFARCANLFFVVSEEAGGHFVRKFG
jgi:hypothetical protein